jgi:DNA-binding winged helix-turn-helix (wHTH) protein
MGQTRGATAIRQRIGEWEVVPELNELRRGDESVRIEPKAMELLAFLAAHPGEVIGRAELLSAVWPGVVVVDEVLTQAVTKLRKALADEARNPPTSRRSPSAAIASWQRFERCPRHRRRP